MEYIDFWGLIPSLKKLLTKWAQVDTGLTWFAIDLIYILNGTKIVEAPVTPGDVFSGPPNIIFNDF